MTRATITLAASVALGVALVAVLSVPMAGLAPIGSILDPWNGLYRTARQTGHPHEQAIRIRDLAGEVTVIRDERGVPHIFAPSDRDAIMALGYVMAQDRLFQMDFIPRVTSGRLSEVLGESGLRTDRFMRSIGLDLGAHRNADRILRSAGIEADVATWYCAGVNAYVGALERRDLPLEFRILNFEPDRCSVLQVARVLQFMTYDLTFRTDDARYDRLRRMLSEEDYAELFPLNAAINEPIVPRPAEAVSGLSATSGSSGPVPADTAVESLAAEHSESKRRTGFGFEHGMGSNNWAVAGKRSTTGSPILAGDMHLRVSLPAIWYEVHLVTPSMNVYGVTLPGAPVPIEAFNQNVAWAFTNTGSDQIDHVALELDSDRRGYLADGEVHPFEVVHDTIRVRGRPVVVDTLLYSEWGPVRVEGNDALALRWVAHDSSRTLRAVWDMLHARNLEEFEAGVRYWDSPMQNILYSDAAGNIAIRSAGFLPIRRDGGGAGVLDGTRGGPIWLGRVPFDELPHARNPDQGYLASANQEPAGAWYPYYLGHDWRRTYRALRINELLRAKDRHSVQDLMDYQADVVAVQGREFTGLLQGVRCPDARAEEVRSRLTAWNAKTTIDDPTTLLFDQWMASLTELTWDEAPFTVMRPYTTQLYRLLTRAISDKWVDRTETEGREEISDLLCASMAVAGAALDDDSPRGWGEDHSIMFYHLLRSDALGSLSRGPFPFPGYSETLSPGGGRMVTHTASWRMVVDLSTTPPSGFGVYPGGASGNPLDDGYDGYLDTYLRFDHFVLENPEEPGWFADRPDISRLTLNAATQ